MNSVEAIAELQVMGYEFEVDGDDINYSYHGDKKWNSVFLRERMEAIKAEKSVAIAWLINPIDKALVL